MNSCHILYSIVIRTICQFFSLLQLNYKPTKNFIYFFSLWCLFFFQISVRLVLRETQKSVFVWIIILCISLSLLNSCRMMNAFCMLLKCMEFRNLSMNTFNIDLIFSNIDKYAFFSISSFDFALKKKKVETLYVREPV